MEVREASASYTGLTELPGDAVPFGYRQTEVGVIPEDWILKPIGDFATITTGSKNTQDRVEDGKFPFFVRSQVVERINSYSFDGEAVLTAGDGVGTGKVFHYIVGKFDVHQRVYRIAEFGDGVSGYFFFLYFSSCFYARIMQMTAKSSVDSVRMEMISRMQVPLPPRDEQRLIAETLSDADALIESLQQLIAKKRHIKQGTMQALLTSKQRLPGFDDEGWLSQPLGDVAPLQRGFDLPTSQLRLGCFPVVYSNGVLAHHSEFRVKGPGLVTGRSGTIGTVTFVDDDFWPHNTSLWVTSFKGNDPKFVFYLYTHLGFERFATGSGVPTLNRNDVHAFKVSIPSNKDEQTAIATILTDMDTELAELETRLAKTRQLKQGMMQELLTGRVRLV